MNPGCASVREHEAAVIGSGPGGCLAACLLAENGHDVLLLEEGRLWEPESIAEFSRQEMEHKYRNGGLTFALGRPRIQYVEACCAGGGSEINSGLYRRLPDAVRNTWNSRFQVDNFDAASLTACAAVNEQELCVQPMPGNPPEASLLLARGAGELGWACREAPRWQRYDTADPGGQRQTVTRTFLPRALAAGAHLLTGAKVDNIRQRKNSLRVEAQTSGETGAGRIAFDVKHVFLAAGAIRSPLLMQRNRLGKNAGKRLHMHPSIKVVALFPDPISFAGDGVPVHQVTEFSPEMSFGCSISNAHYLAVAMLPHKNGLELLRDRMPYSASFYAMIVPEGRGSVRCLPGFNDPLVTFALSRADYGLLALALKRLCLLLFRAGAEAVYTPLPGLGALTDTGQLRMLPRSLAGCRAPLMTIHLASTCSMSADAKLGVTDSWGAVHGEKDLHVSDAALLCSAPGVNPQGPLMAVVRRNINHWLEQHG
jgi:choline dehydrogenase-like flavoprotein